MSSAAQGVPVHFLPLLVRNLRPLILTFGRSDHRHYWFPLSWNFTPFNSFGQHIWPNCKHLMSPTSLHLWWASTCCTITLQTGNSSSFHCFVWRLLWVHGSVIAAVNDITKNPPFVIFTSREKYVLVTVEKAHGVCLLRFLLTLAGLDFEHCPSYYRYYPQQP